MADQVLNPSAQTPPDAGGGPAVSRRGPGPVRRFFDWWLGELKGLLPHALKRLVGMANRTLVVDLVSEQMRVRLWRGDRCQDLGWQPLLREAGQEGGGGDVAALAARVDTRLVRVPRDQVLVRDVVLPLATEGNLREVLGFEMDRLTPFKVGQVAYDYIKRQRNIADGTVKARLYVVPKERLRFWVDRLKMMGIHPSALSVIPDEADLAAPIIPFQPNLLGDREIPRVTSPSSRVLRILAWLILLLATTAVLLPIWSQYRYITRLEQAIAQVRADVMKSRQLSAQRKQVFEDYRFVRRHRAVAYRVIDGLKELTRVLPDDTWLNRLQVNRDWIGMQGESADGSKVLSLIENSPLFEQTRFVAPVVRVPGRGTDRFNVRARFVGKKKT